MAPWLGRLDQIERMTRVSTTQLAPQPSMMCITIIRLARSLIQAGASRAPLVLVTKPCSTVVSGCR